MEETISKRLHVSGLTPAITPDDLSQRLGGFGIVKALDGFNLVDAVGQPRKFGYVTLETTKKQLGRCMNLLSGVTWKGAKLRIGEAKPDFRESIALEHALLKCTAEENEGPQRKRRRLPRGVQGVHATDMSLVTAENVASRPGWRVTPTGRLIRPIRMRPDHPLPDPLPIGGGPRKGENIKDNKGKLKKRLKDPPIRARKRTIDPTRWGAQHLKGAFLDSVVADDAMDSSAHRSITIRQNIYATSDVHTETSSEGESLEEETRDNGEPASIQVSVKQGFTSQPESALPRVIRQSSHNLVQFGEQDDLEREKQRSLGLLQALFGDQDENWGSQESVDSDVEINDWTRQANSFVPMDAPVQGDERTEVTMDLDDQDISTNAVASKESPRPPTVVPMQTTKLKDLFAPREEDAGFSLLGHLNVDLELDDTIDLEAPVQQVYSAPTRANVPLILPSIPAFDLKRPLFFPLSPEESRGRTRHALDPTDWRAWFYRTDSTEDIQKRWEETRGELTSGWKRRHREAIKSRRRRGGLGDGDI
ncbi:uncharacterized protein FIBRA_02631 [Fibroporia radiculosa]|uniref:RRM domain-containing protein n=1 Tax=Fibroporia radiculosa TaxID=599839 RepID=J4GN06_9APHY|nr:uncharacterized protein FIBRA_02631 [Fibroporia radiculosa]CCM00595.1 predicted protein [Fibroporia radiculosa]